MWMNRPGLDSDSTLMRITRVAPGKFVAPLTSVRTVMTRMGFKTPTQVARGERMSLRGLHDDQKEIHEAMTRRARAQVRNTIGLNVDTKA